jgi:hypothetical protein
LSGGPAQIQLETASKSAWESELPAFGICEPVHMSTQLVPQQVVQASEEAPDCTARSFALAAIRRWRSFAKVVANVATDSA